MKGRFTTIDLQAILKEISPRLIGMRCANVYDINKKTYLLKLSKPPEKAVLLLESGIRVHTTEYEWPKSDSPSAFAMKCRKHIRTRRLNGINQIGTDRIVCFTFGANETTHHLVVELYDKGNILLLNHEFVILSLLRPRSDTDDVKYAVHERYPIEAAHLAPNITREKLASVFSSAKDQDPMRKYLNPILACGPAVIEHALIECAFPPNACVNKGFDPTSEDDMDRLFKAAQMTEKILDQVPLNAGYIITKEGSGTKNKNKSIASNSSDDRKDELVDKEKTQFFDEFHPFLMRQHESKCSITYPSFDRAIDVFFSEMEAQKLELRTLAQEAAALKKLDNVKVDHERRLQSLKEAQEAHARRAELIELNIPTVDKAIQVVNSALASSMEWKAIEEYVAEARAKGDTVAQSISGLKLHQNKITMKLLPPYEESSDSNSEEDSDSDDFDAVEEDGKNRKKSKTNNSKTKSKKKGPLSVDIDLGLSAYANARVQYDTKRSSAAKEKKTMESSEVALKSAEKKTAAALKDVKSNASMQKARKQYWFEKFMWFISSENYLMVGGRDQQQNEQIVKRYLTKNDVYVHADFHGAASCVIKNPSGGPVPPKTLSEAGQMAVCHSAAWDAKIVTGAYWVNADQVSKSAPSGEYLPTGSFMVRGKKNFIAAEPLVLGIGMLFKVDESCIPNHMHERVVKVVGDSIQESPLKEVTGGDSESSHRDPTGAVSSKPDAQENKNETGADDEDDGKPQPSQFESADAETEATEIEFPDTDVHLRLASGSSVASSIAESSQDIEKSELSGKAGGRLSAKEKRMRRKQRQMEQSGMSPEEIEEKAMAAATAAATKPEKQASKSESKTNEPNKAQQGQKRGAKKKMQKIKAKYAEQDDEERELAMSILASDNPHGKLTKKAKRQQRKKTGQVGSKQVGASGKQGLELPAEALAKMGDSMVVKTTKFENWNTEKAAEAQQAKDERMRSLAEQEEEEEIRKILEDENIQTLDENDKDSISYLSALTGCPREDDVIAFAMPVVAPMSTLNSYKYRVKILPGTTRKGRAGNTALHMFQSSRFATPREKEVMKFIKDNEMQANLPGKVKLMGGAR